MTCFDASMVCTSSRFKMKCLSYYLRDGSVREEGVGGRRASEDVKNKRVLWVCHHAARGRGAQSELIRLSSAMSDASLYFNITKLVQHTLKTYLLTFKWYSVMLTQHP